MTRRARQRGVTLLELMVTLVISGIVLGALFGVVQSQQTAFYEGQLQRAAQGSARSAAAFVEQRLSIAGYGMDPSLAFDFTSAQAPCPSLAAPCDRDRVNGNDELVFHARNPGYWVPDDHVSDPVGNAWRIQSVVGNTVTVNARAGDRFLRGRILQAVCKNATRYAYFTVETSAIAAAAAALPIPLAAVVASNPFRRQDTAAAAVDPCFNSGEARLFLIDRFRFHVRPVQVGPLVQPYLVLDTGLDANGDGPDDAEEVVVAEGIESFQVGYLMTNTALVPRGTIAGTPITYTAGAAGVTAGNGLTTLDFPGFVDPAYSEYRSTSWYGYAVGPPPSAQRLTDHQANIRAVRIAIVARGPDPDPGAAFPDVVTPVLNQTTLPSWVDSRTPYPRARVEATIPVRNMTVRAMTDF